MRHANHFVAVDLYALYDNDVLSMNFFSLYFYTFLYFISNSIKMKFDIKINSH